MSDRDLLERAAKAAGINFVWDFRLLPSSEHVPVAGSPHDQYSWNPLIDDGSAFRLAVKLHLDVTHWGGSTNVNKPGVDPVHAVEHWGPKGDHYAATRRAIVRAAAAMAGDAP